MGIENLQVHAEWDDDARVWIATSEDVPGLCIEEETLERLLDTVAGLVPELLALNNVTLPPARSIPVHVVAERTTTVALS